MLFFYQNKPPDNRLVLTLGYFYLVVAVLAEVAGLKNRLEILRLLDKLRVGDNLTYCDPLIGNLVTLRIVTYTLAKLNQLTAELKPQTETQ
jgi:hypothetical protein